MFRYCVFVLPARRFTELSRDERSCRRTIFFRAKTMLASLETTKLTIIYLLQR